MSAANRVERARSLLHGKGNGVGIVLDNKDLNEKIVGVKRLGHRIVVLYFELCKVQSILRLV